MELRHLRHKLMRQTDTEYMRIFADESTQSMKRDDEIQMRMYLSVFFSAALVVSSLCM